jgi:hypothetical protein
MAPATVGGADAGSRPQFTTEVAEVDATCAELVACGVMLLKPHARRPGLRHLCQRDRPTRPGESRCARS